MNDLQELRLSCFIYFNNIDLNDKQLTPITWLKRLHFDYPSDEFESTFATLHHLFPNIEQLVLGVCFSDSYDSSSYRHYGNYDSVVYNPEQDLNVEISHVWRKNFEQHLKQFVLLRKVTFYDLYKSKDFFNKLEHILCR